MSTPKVYRFFQRIVREVITYRANNNVTRPDYMQHLITLSKKGSIADDKNISNGYVSQQNSTYTRRVRALFMFGLHGAQIRHTDDNSKPDVPLVALSSYSSIGPSVSYEKTLL
jgi:hypothetical protein